MVIESQEKIVEAFHFQLSLGSDQKKKGTLLFTMKLSVSYMAPIMGSSLVVPALLSYSWWIMIGLKCWIGVAKPYKINMVSIETCSIGV